jgi:acetyltransferase
VKEARASLAFSAEVRITPFRAGGVELIVGARRDAALGPIALVGAGGVLTEIAGDVAIRTLPCGAEELEEMVSQTIAGRWLGGRGGRARWQRGPVVEILESLARLITALPEVSEVEVNPLRCDESGVVALDARVLVAS